jgi:gamma-glutamyltranspeptidase/glutathione hydrolase
MDIKAAIDRPHVTTTGSGVDIEPGPGAEALAADLAARGHQVSVRDLNSGLHGISIAPDGILAGAADPRREGAARGR